MGLFREIRALPAAIHRLTATIQAFAELQRETQPGDSRLDELERARATWEAEMEGLVMKADSTLRAAKNAEQRERQLKKANEKFLDPFDPDSEEREPTHGMRVPRFDAQAGEEEGLLPVRMGLETNTKAHAIRAKWGG